MVVKVHRMARGTSQTAPDMAMTSRGSGVHSARRFMEPKRRVNSRDGKIRPL